MPGHETLDTIADAYIPALAILSLGYLAIDACRFKGRGVVSRLLSITSALAIAYGLMLFDSKFRVWQAVGLDYSTHTAVSLALVAFLSAIRPRLSILWLGSILAYAVLMLYQGYHSLPDILVTSAIVIVPAWLVLAYGCHRWPFASSTASACRTPRP